MKALPRILASSISAAAFATTLLAQSSHAAAPKTPRPISDTYGTTTESYYRVAAAEFSPLESSTTYSDRILGAPFFGRYSTGAEGHFVATAHLPSGALLTYFELDSCDTSTPFGVHGYLYNCDYSGACDPPRLLLSDDNVGPGCSYTYATSGLGQIVNNYGGQILIEVSTGAGDSSTTFSGVVLGYRLQVAPPPATATFDDIHTDHPYFQFIEALSSWGITSGCSSNPPDYCPERPITRGEMAVYVAKALGLYLPQY